MRTHLRGLPLAGLALAALPYALVAQAGASDPSFAGFTPGRCVVAARIIDGLNRRDVPDTTSYSPKKDTLFSATTDALKGCERAYGGTTSESWETLNLGRVQLLTRQDSIALATARRHLGTVGKRTPEERAWELYLVISDNLAGKPARVAPAKDALAELDRLGKPAAGMRVLAHYAMAQIARAHYDDQLLRAETDAVVTAWRELPEEGQLYRATSLAYSYLLRAQLAALTTGGNAARAVMDTARGVVPPAAQQARSVLEYATRMYRNMDKTAPRLEAEFWYNTGAAMARPTKGTVSLILNLSRPCVGYCESLLDAMKRFERRFQGRGLEQTFLSQTYGFYLDTAPAPPLEEARYDSSYFLGELRIPGALGIAETKYTWKADGRRQNSPTTNQGNYPASGVLFVDKRGIIRYVASSWDSQLEERYAQIIERLLAEQVEAQAGP